MAGKFSYPILPIYHNPFFLYVSPDCCSQFDNQYLTIPLFAGAVGWLTNKLAVDMIFYPVNFVGYGQRAGSPLGLFGWQGIVPAKAASMAERLTEMVTTKLIDVRQIFGRLSPDQVSFALPHVSQMSHPMLPIYHRYLGFSARAAPRAGGERDRRAGQVLIKFSHYPFSPQVTPHVFPHISLCFFLVNSTSRWWPNLSLRVPP